MKRATLALLVLWIAGCATLRSGPSDAKLRLDAGIDALGRRDFAAAAAGLEDVSRAGDPALARRALLLLAVTQLDPGNPARDAQAASVIAGRLREGAVPGSIEYIAAETLERVVRETRDLHQDMIAARMERDRAWTHIDSLRARIDLAVVERDSVQRRTVRLELVRDSLDAELKKTTQELERIRRAIRG
ncbi:MAG TPA: hypothetical protein VMM79_03550 [Longimicrobiales bacterium]|nr:hypothetical protein [Longimicrobiales bacterium]